MFNTKMLIVCFAIAVLGRLRKYFSHLQAKHVISLYWEWMWKLFGFTSWEEAQLQPSCCFPGSILSSHKWTIKKTKSY